MVSIKIPKYNIDGQKSGYIELKTSYNDLKLNLSLINQVIAGYQSNARQVLANTKTRAEVRGGGRKPWRQKGTGRARIGSTRAPHWIGGGIVFGPRKNRNFKKDLSQNMRRKALAEILSKKNEEGEIFAVELPKFEKIKTKNALSWLSKIPLKEGNILLALDKANPVLYLSTRNLTYWQNKPAKDINALDLLQYDNILFTHDAVKQISIILMNSKKSKKISNDNKKRITVNDIKKNKPIKLVSKKPAAK